MARGDVETISKDGQWVNRVEGEEELSQGYASKEEAIEEGRRLAAATLSQHTVRDEPATGVVTDEQEPGEDSTPAVSPSDGTDDDESDDDEADDDEADDVIEVEDLP
ncbi:MAG: DUF2188 domain-containing protein [Microbacterium sp.]